MFLWQCSAENKNSFVFFLSHHHCLFHLTGGLSPDGLGLQGAPHTANTARTFLHRLLSLCPSSPKEREAWWTQGEMSWTVQSSRSTGLSGLASIDDTNENWGVGWCALTAAFNTSISRKRRLLTYSHYFEVPVIGLGISSQRGLILRCPFIHVLYSRSLLWLQPSVPCGNVLEMYRCTCVQLDVVMQHMTLYLCKC